MNCYYNGSISCYACDRERFLEVFKEHNLLPNGNYNTEEKDGKFIINYENDSFGYIEDDLTIAVEKLWAEDIDVEGSLDYYGDYEGRDVVAAGVVENLDHDEVVMRDVSDTELLAEAARRGFKLVKEKGCDIENAEMEADESDPYDDDCDRCALLYLCDKIRCDKKTDRGE